MPVKPILHELDHFLDPVDVYGVLRNEPYSSFLDSGMDPQKLGRFSFIGYAPFMVVESEGENIKVLTEDGTEILKDNPFTFLKSLLEHYKTERVDGDIPFVSGCVGYFSYDLRFFLEKLPRISGSDIDMPDIALSFYDIVLIFDNLLKKAYVSSSGLPHLGEKKNRDRAIKRLESAVKRFNGVSLVHSDPFDCLAYRPPVSTGNGQADARSRFGAGLDVQTGAGVKRDIASNFTMDDYKKAVEKAKDYIKEGDIYQVNLSQRLVCDFDGDSFELYKTLRRINPAPFAAYLNFGEFQIASASPERFIKIDKRCIETRPIKGTRPRGKSEDKDVELKSELLSSEKDKAEHLMIVDLERNDIGKVSEYGSVALTEFMISETYSTVHHLVSTISGRLWEGIGVVDCLCSCFPGGSITGAPKIRAMEIIEEIEPVRRGVYTGSIGYIDFSGNADLSIVIRTAVMKGGAAYFQVGGGIVADSEPEKEYNETMDKASAIIQAINIEKAKRAAADI